MNQECTGVLVLCTGSPVYQNFRTEIMGLAFHWSVRLWRLKRRGIIIESPASVAFVTHPVIFCLKWSEVVFARPWSVSYSFSFELEGVSFSL